MLSKANRLKAFLIHFILTLDFEWEKVRLNQPDNGVCSFSLSGFALQQCLTLCASFHPAVMRICVPCFLLALLKR